jgi:PAS domain S-box-containing protein
MLAATVEYSDDAIFGVSLDGRIKSWNPAAARIFGFSDVEAVGHQVELLYPGDRHAQAEELMCHIRAGEHVLHHETRPAHKNGAPLIISMTISPTRALSGGRISGASIVARDIQDQKEAEDRLRISEAFYHSLVETLPQNIFRKDLEGRFTFANRRFCQTLDKPLAEIVGHTDFDFFPEAMAAKYKEDDLRVSGENRVFETVEEHLLPGGRRIYVNVCKAPIQDAEGHTIGVQGIFWDITDQKEAELALRHSEERYRTLLGSVTDYLYTVELKEGVPTATRHGPGCMNVTGYQPEDYQALSYLWYLMVYEDDRAAVVAQAARVIEGKAEPLEHRIVHRDGSIRWVRNTQVPRRDETGKVVAYDGLVTDITERKNAEEKLHQANAELAQSRQVLLNALEDLKKSHEEIKAAQRLLIHAEKMESVGRLAAGVAHEVKNPLAILQSGIDYLKQSLPPSDENSALVLGDMVDALARADGVIRGLLDFAAAQELGVRVENLNAMVERPMALMRHELAKNRIRLERELAPATPPVLADRPKLEQVFVNVIMNAIQAMPQGGELRVRTSTRQLSPGEVTIEAGNRSSSTLRAGDHVAMIEFLDTGTGIPPDQITKVWEPFYTTKPTGVGTGLGLTVSKKIIDMHGGRMDIENRTEGGVRVAIMFKAADPK